MQPWPHIIIYIIYITLHYLHYIYIYIRPSEQVAGRVYASVVADLGYQEAARGGRLRPLGGGGGWGLAKPSEPTRGHVEIVGRHVQDRMFVQPHPTAQKRRVAA